MKESEYFLTMAYTHLRSALWSLSEAGPCARASNWEEWPDHEVAMAYRAIDDTKNKLAQLLETVEDSAA